MKKPESYTKMTFQELAKRGEEVLSKQRGYTYEEMLEQQKRRDERYGSAHKKGQKEQGTLNPIKS